MEERERVAGEDKEKEERRGGAEVRGVGGAEANARRAKAEEDRREFIVRAGELLPTGQPDV